jgi:hypothetical protein
VGNLLSSLKRSSLTEVKMDAQPTVHYTASFLDEALSYTGEKRGFTFNTYVNKHVEQHHLMDELAGFGPRPPDDGLKIQWFQAGIECDLFSPVGTAIMTDRARFLTFEAVKEAYIDFARQQTRMTTRRVTAVPYPLSKGAVEDLRDAVDPAAPGEKTIKPSVTPVSPPRSRWTYAPTLRTGIIPGRSIASSAPLRGSVSTNYRTQMPSQAMDYFPGCSYLPSKNPGTIEKNIN